MRKSRIERKVFYVTLEPFVNNALSIQWTLIMSMMVAFKEYEIRMNQRIESSMLQKSDASVQLHCSC